MSACCRHRSNPAFGRAPKRSGNGDAACGTGAPMTNPGKLRRRQRLFVRYASVCCQAIPGGTFRRDELSPTSVMRPGPGSGPYSKSSCLFAERKVPRKAVPGHSGKVTGAIFFGDELNDRLLCGLGQPGEGRKRNGLQRRQVISAGLCIRGRERLKQIRS